MAQDFWGTGPAYPFVRTSGGNFAMASGKDLVEMCLKQCLQTIVGSRPMFKRHGNMLERVIFMLEGTERDLIVKEFIDDGIVDFEPRVIIIDVAVTDGREANEAFINVQWDVLNGNDPRNTLITKKMGE